VLLVGAVGLVVAGVWRSVNSQPRPGMTGSADVLHFAAAQLRPTLDSNQTLDRHTSCNLLPSGRPPDDGK